MSHDAPRRTKARTWVVRGLIVALVLVAAAAGVGFYMFRSAVRVPDFYARERLSGEQRLEAIASVERKFGNFQDALGRAAVRPSTARAAPVGADAEDMSADAQDGQDAEPPEPARLSFTADELDTYFDKWLRDNGYSEAFGTYLSEPRLLLSGGHIVLAGRADVPNVGRPVLSMRFAPHLGEDGRAELSLAGVFAGSVPLPEGVVQPMRERAAAAVQSRLPDYVNSAAIDANGVANQAAVDLTIDRQIGRLIADEPLNDLVLFPYLIGRGPVATRVVELEVDNDSLTLGFSPLSAAEREAYIASIKAAPLAPVDLSEVADAS